MTEENFSMQNGVMHFIASDYEPIPGTSVIRTRSHIYGRRINREAISLMARYWERAHFDIAQFSVSPKTGIHSIHKEHSPSKKHREQHLKDNAYARAMKKYAALFQKELRRQKNLPIDGSVIEDGVSVTIPSEEDIVLAYDCDLKRPLNRRRINS